MTRTNDEVLATLRSRLERFGKLGLLVEDAHDAKLRVARELYGSDGLPPWWAHYDNLVQASAAAEGLCALLGIDASAPSAAPAPVRARRPVPAIAVIDRYLRHSSDSSQLVPWDDEGRTEEAGGAVATAGDRMRRACQALTRATGSAVDRDRRTFIAMVTSFWYRPEDEEASAFQWDQRSHEPLYRLRREIERCGGEARTLLRFGPRGHQSLTEGAAPGVADDEGEVEWHRRAWRPALEALAAAFARRPTPRESCKVLFTGAGAAYANDPLAPGMPPTSFLLDWACWRVLDGRPEVGRLREPRWLGPPRSAAGGGPSRQKRRLSSVAEILEWHISGRSVADADWQLHELLDPGGRSSQDQDRFLDAMRIVLQRFNLGFPYHSWLLAQLPWTLIVTTNFDSFHEHAAWSAQNRPAFEQSSDEVRRRGDLLALETLRSRPGVARAASDVERFAEALLREQSGPCLVKTHGSATSTDRLMWTAKDFKEPLPGLSSLLERLIEGADETWLIFLGKDIAVPPASDAMLGLVESEVWGPKLTALWVDPLSYRRIRENPREHLAPFNKTLETTGAHPELSRRGAWPLPAKALEFAYDLFEYYREARLTRP